MKRGGEGESPLSNYGKITYGESSTSSPLTDEKRKGAAPPAAEISRRGEVYFDGLNQLGGLLSTRKEERAVHLLHSACRPGKKKKKKRKGEMRHFWKVTVGGVAWPGKRRRRASPSLRMEGGNYASGPL